MKTLKKVFVSVFALLLTFSVFASDNIKPESSTEALKKEIKKSIAKIDLENFNLADNTVKVHFIVNDHNQIVVLRTDHNELDSIIKVTLNYKKLKDEVTDIHRNSLYSINLNLEKEKL